MEEKKKGKKGLIIIIIIVVVLALAGAGLYYYLNNSKVTVYFETYDGTPISPVIVKSGERVYKPADPEMEGFRFEKWTRGGGEAYDFTNPVYNDMTLFAEFVKTFKVSFVVDGKVISTATVDDLDSVVPVEAPEMEKKVFMYWTRDGEYEYFFEERVAEDITLTAKYVNAFTVAFYNGNVLLEKTDFAEGSTINSYPDRPVKEGYKFVSWTYKDGKRWDGTTKITKDLNLYASFRRYKPITSMKFDSSTFTVKKNHTVYLSMDISPSDWAEEITYTSANSKIGTVTPDGLFVAVSEGTVEVTAESENGLTCKCKVTVTPEY